MIDYLIDDYYILILVIGFVVLLFNDLRIKNSKSRVLKLLIVEVAAVTVFNALEYYFSTLDSFNYGRLIFSFLCYSLRPVIIITFITLLTNNKIMKFLYGLSFVNALIYSTCFFSSVAFSFGENNNFIRGPLGYSTHILCIFYLIILIYLIIKRHSKQTWNKTIMLLFVSISSTLAAFLDFAIASNLFDQTILICVLFYYLFLYMEYNKIDELTNTFNRRTFYNDLQTYNNSITSIISIDMNNLKQINDKLGHLEGDKALIKLAESLLNSEKNKARFYRVGGDEFVAICFNSNEEQVKKIIKRIKNNMSKTPYTCSTGYEMCKLKDDKFEVYKKADEKMYKEKEEFHQKQKMNNKPNKF